MYLTIWLYLSNIANMAPLSAPEWRLYPGKVMTCDNYYTGNKRWYHKAGVMVKILTEKLFQILQQQLTTFQRVESNSQNPANFSNWAKDEMMC